ncbi:hypothetical protein [Pseudactinotalea sp. Z1732]|uniref:hypothetical protein n=1 Tax=Micrococcales TaxID=85006 RepID=UPI003C7B3E16
MTTNDGGTRVPANTYQQPVARHPGPGPDAAHQVRGGRTGLGWLFLAPALVLVLFQQVIPAVRTFVLSLQDGSMRTGGAWVGTANYQTIATEGLLRAVLFTALVGAVIAVVGFAAGFVLGLPARAATGTARRVGLAMAALALTFVAPVASVIGVSLWVNPVSAARLSQLLVWLPVTIAIGFGVGVLARPPARAGRTLAVGAAVAAMAGAALSVQSPVGVLVGLSFADPAAMIYHFSFLQLRTGAGAAVSTVLILVTAVLGVLATRVLLASRLRLRIGGGHTPEHPERGEHVAHPGHPAAVGNRPRGGAGAVIGGVVVLLLAAVASAPWLFAEVFAPGDPMPSGRGLPAANAALLNTWLGGAGEVLLVVVVAGLAGAGIGYHRPLGERSVPVLLTILSPMLFLGLVPLMTVHYLDRSDLGLIGTFLGTVRPHLVVVPLVFLCAYLADARRTSLARAVVARRTSLAAVGLAAGVLLLLRSESIWSLLVGRPGDQDAVMMAFQAWQMRMIPEALGLLKPWPVLVLMAALLVTCAIGVSRLQLGHEEPRAAGVGAGGTDAFGGYGPTAQVSMTQGRTAHGSPVQATQQYPYHGPPPQAPGAGPQQYPYHGPPPQAPPGG